MKYRLKENEEEAPQGSGIGKVEYNLLVVPDDMAISELVAAFEDPKNYGRYMSNIVNSDAKLKKSLEKYFGPSVPSKKKAAEKERGKPFPQKTKAAVDKFIELYNKATSKTPTILSFEIDGPGLLFRTEANPPKATTKKIIQTVMDSVGQDFKFVDVEAEEDDGIDISDIEENASLTLDVSTTGKIYDVLKTKYPEIGRQYTKSAFYHFLNDSIK